MKNRKLTWLKSTAIFVGFTIYFYLLLFTLYPFLKETFTFNPALNWFITGYCLFIPLLVLSIVLVKREGNKKFITIIKALNIKRMSKIDLVYSIVGLLIVFFLTGIIFAISIFLNNYFGIRLLSTTPWFMEIQPFQGSEKLLLLVWLPMFFFNIVGEELLWRGYIQSRLDGKLAWLKCSILWMIFHLPFGFDLMIMLIPIILVVPFIYSKTENSLTGIFIHGLYNGPIFVLISLGVAKF